MGEEFVMLAKVDAGSWRLAPPVAAATPQGAPAFSVTVAPVAGTEGKHGTSFVVTVPPNAGAQAAVAGPTPEAGGRLALAAPAAK